MNEEQLAALIAATFWSAQLQHNDNIGFQEAVEMAYDLIDETRKASRERAENGVK